MRGCHMKYLSEDVRSVAHVRDDDGHVSRHDMATYCANVHV